MTREELKAGIDALRFTMEMLLFDPGTGQTKEVCELNELDKITYDGCIAGITALEKAEKYKWHDLRKNPEDLPNYDCRVEICIELKTCDYNSYVFGTYHKFKNGCVWFSDDFSSLKDAIAWREIEPFEEVE